MTTPYYMDNTVNLYHTDSLEWLKQREDKSIDCVFSDPPYFLTSNPEDMSYKGEWDKSKGAKKDFDFHFAWITEAYRVLKDDGVIWITGTHHSIYQCGYALQLAGFHVLNEISWYKPSRRFENLKNNLAFSHETIIFARKNKDVRQYMNWKYLNKSQDKFHTDGLTMPTIWDIRPCPKSEIPWHNTPKPVELLKRIIMLSTKPNALILDPFNGSGTTGIATMECGHGRRYIGLDQSEEYLRKTVERIEKKKQQKTAFDEAINDQNIHGDIR
jgi:site-specific DNA-methyltransferase (adenine-specific)